jgi:hypothetical protein
MVHRNIILLLLFASHALTAFSQKKMDIVLSRAKGERRIIVTAHGKPFTSFFYPDSLAKPILFPIYAPDGQIITRGFPLSPRADDPTDHPHHTGLWFNYENVNGLDFWNNSYAIPQEKKSNYGYISTDTIVNTINGQLGSLTYLASWRKQSGVALIREKTEYIFTVDGNAYIIDRITSLLALDTIHFADAKDGCLGLRVAHSLELPSAQPSTYTDEHGVKTTVPASMQTTGNYLTSTGKTGDSAWGTRANWCMLYGKLKQDTIAIIMIDHPGNPGYPTYWHARGYGLFAANPLGQKIFSNGKEQLNLKLDKGQSVTFRFRIIIMSGKERPTEKEIAKFSSDFALATRMP